MKKLYISDLDGTLLNSNMEVSSNTVNILNKLIANGMFFSIATARTASTVSHILQNININVPIILMNGVCIYNLQNRTYVKIESLSYNSLEGLFTVLESYKISGFLYEIENGEICTYYTNTDSPNANSFMNERKKKYNKRFEKVDSFRECLTAKRNLVYYSLSDTKENLELLYKKLSSDLELNIEFYRDIYNENYWYLEICSAKASKYSALMYIRKKYNFEYVVSFGDNLNDIPMFHASDESCAVSNAKDEVKNVASHVIGGNNENGVAEYLLGM